MHSNRDGDTHSFYDLTTWTPTGGPWPEPRLRESRQEGDRRAWAQLPGAAGRVSPWGVSPQTSRRRVISGDPLPKTTVRPSPPRRLGPWARSELGQTPSSTS